MSENLSPPAPITISQWLKEATLTLLSADIHSARLDALILLEDELQKERSWILAHEDTLVEVDRLKVLNQKIAHRQQRIPLAYIRGFVEFYGRQFYVTPDVLIPRPETEEMIELLKALPIVPTPESGPSTLVDVGSGSGCIGITAKLELPQLDVHLVDIDESTLRVAQENGRRHDVKIQYRQDNLLLNSSGNAYSIITANLPYVARGFEISKDAEAEPDIALFAEDEGYMLIEQLLPQAAQSLLPEGYLLLESDPWQQDRIIEKAALHNFALHDRRLFHLVLQKSAQKTRR